MMAFLRSTLPPVRLSLALLVAGGSPVVGSELAENTDGASSSEAETIPAAEVVSLEPLGVSETPDDSELVPSLLRIARNKSDEGLHEDARLALYAILELDTTDAEEVQVFSRLAESYRATEQYTRAAAILEKLMETYPGSPEIPRTLLHLGRIYRDMGVGKLAVARFYAVLNATLKLDHQRLTEYQLLARTAQFEIAETHLRFGRFEDASEYFRRLSLLDLAPEDRARAQFKVAYALHLGKDYAKAVRDFRRFLQQNSEGPDVPEALYLLSLALERQAQHEESLAEALKLFDPARIPEEERDDWRYWQRRAGNHLANEFFRNGRLTHALQLYTQLAAVSSEPHWKAPALYQVGLSAERLGDYPRAKSAYAEVLSLAEETPALREIGAMAQWRSDHLEWMREFEADRTRIIGPTTSQLSPPLARNEQP